jgi:hypothetical protein
MMKLFDYLSDCKLFVETRNENSYLRLQMFQKSWSFLPVSLANGSGCEIGQSGRERGRPLEAVR